MLRQKETGYVRSILGGKGMIYIMIKVSYRAVQLVRGNLTFKITLDGENHGLFRL